MPTASRFDSILTEKTRKFSKSAESYAVELAVERIIGQPLDDTKSGWMERGTEMEAEARAWYIFHQDAEVEQVGFCTTDDGKVGCSPDGLVGRVGLEIKCPSAKVHGGHLIGKTRPGDDTQVQGSLLVTGFDAWDCVSYCRGLPPVLIRRHRDERFLADLTLALTKFLVGVETAERRIRGLGVRGRIEGFSEDEDTELMAALYASLKEEPNESE